MESTEPFPVALGKLITDNDYVTVSGRPNWAAFAPEIEGFHYETLRRAATGRRTPTPRLMEECARALRLRPEYFLEYRVHLAQRDFDPATVGHERAIENLALWKGTRRTSPAPADRRPTLR